MSLRFLRRLPCLFLPLVVCFPAGAVAATSVVVHVDPRGGNDDHDGLARERGVRSLAKARELARRALEGGAREVRVRLGGGLHRLEEALVLDERDGGPANGRVVWESAPGERAVVDGGVAITGWHPAGDGLWAARVEGRTFRQLHVDGRRATLARSALNGFVGYRLDEPELARVLEVPAGSVARLGDLAGMEIVLYRNWAPAILPVAASERIGEVVRIRLPPIAERNLFAWFHLERQKYHFRGNAFYFQNAFALLDEPGEWFLDAANGLLFYKPRPGEDLRTAEVVAPALETLLRIRGSSETATVSRITIRGIEFAHTGWTEPSLHGHINGQAVTSKRLLVPDRVDGKVDFAGWSHGELMPAAIHVENARGIVLAENIVRDAGANGISLFRNTEDCTVEGNLLTGLSGTGIVADNVVEAGRTHSVRDRIVDNIVEHAGLDYQGAVGIFVGYARDAVIERNTLRHLPYSGISVGWGWSDSLQNQGGNSIRANHVHDVMEELCDGGGIYHLSRSEGTVIAGNLVHDLVKSPFAGLMTIHGIYLDNGTTRVTVEDNVITGVVGGPEIREQQHGNVKAYGNTLRRNEADTPDPRSVGASERTHRLAAALRGGSRS